MPNYACYKIKERCKFETVAIKYLKILKQLILIDYLTRKMAMNETTDVLCT